MKQITHTLKEEQFNLELGPLKINSTGFVSIILAVLIGIAFIKYASSKTSTKHWKSVAGFFKKKRAK